MLNSRWMAGTIAARMTRLTARVMLVGAMLGSAAALPGQGFASDRATAPTPLQIAALSRELYQTGQAQKDPLMMLTAAKLRKQVGTPGAKDGPLAPLAPGADADWLDWSAMIDAALALAGPDNDQMQELAEDIRAERSKGKLDSPARTVDEVKPRQKNTYEAVPFVGGTYAEVYVEGSGTTDIDLFVHDKDGYLVCSDSDASDIIYCGWMPEATAPYDITIVNKGATVNRYAIMTN